MKRLFAKLLSFIMMIIMIVAVICRTSENFPAVQRITKITSECTEDGAWKVGTTETGVLAKIPRAGRLMEKAAEPKGFAVCMTIYFILLFMGRKKAQRKVFSEPYRSTYDNFYLSVSETSVEDVSETSLSDTSLSETS